MMHNFIKIENHKSLRDVVYEELKMQILTGKVAPGTRMMEVELAEKLGVSRTPIREAIKKLEKEGLVSVELRRGTYVSQVSKEDIIHILEVRQKMDGLAAYYAAQRATKEQIEAIKEAEAEYMNAVRSDTAEAIKIDEKYHAAVVEATNNKTLMQMISELQELVLRFRYIYYDHFKNADKMIAEHSDIVKAIENGDAEKAQKLAEEHVGSLMDLVKNTDITHV